jgi:aminoglycoside N3'-acetyltransferase
MKTEEIIRLLQPLQLSGQDIIVHCSPVVFGLSEQDALPICEALIELVGSRGTILVPTFTHPETLLGDAPTPVPFFGNLPVSDENGALGEAFRTLPGVVRSNHPSHSFAAHGQRAALVLSTQRDNNPLGPIKKLNVMRGHALLLGTTLCTCTAVHIAEEAAPPAFLARKTAMRINAAGYRERVVLEQVPGCSVAFDRLEERLDPGQVVSTALPAGTARKMPIRYVVRLAAAALADDPSALICDRPDCVSCDAKRAAVRGDRSNAA